MSSEPGHGPKVGTAGAKAILCARCERLNAAGSEVCDRCGDDLFFICSHCKTRNARVFSRCRKCGRLPGNSTVKALTDLSVGVRILNPFTILGVLVVVLLIFLVAWALKGSAAVRLW